MISSTKNVLKEKQNDSKTKESKDVKVAKESEDTNDFEIYEVAEDTKECKNAKEFKSSNDIKESEDTNDCEIIKDFEDFEITEVSEDIKDFEITQVSKETNVTPTLAKEYKGSSYCSHNKIKSQCIHCGGKGLCCHGRQKSRCKDCKTGTSICPHGNVNSRCKLCKGSSYCEHGIIKYTCRDCKGGSICEHNKVRSTCRDCKGGSICEHQRRRDQCFDCLGGAYCKHKIRKNYCKECGGSSLCKSEWCTISGMKKYNGYCLNCCINICPDIEVYRNYKTKEKEVVDEVIKEFPDFTWIADKKIAGGCSKRRPDLLLDMGDNIIIIEVDENKHTSYDCSCENKRLMEISQDVGHRPIIFLRFNPDGYETDEGIKVTSCWKANKKGILQIARNKKVEWKNRIKSLTDTISYWINNKTEKTIEIIELFY